jgi:hypothetical protein
MPTRVWVVKGPEWQRTSLALREIDNKLPSWLRDEMDDAVEPLVKQAQAAVMNVNIRGGPAGSTGLRKRVAASVRQRNGVVGVDPYIRLYTQMAERDEAPIPKGMDQAAGWRHPLFGDKRHWFQSTPVKTGWFTETIEDGRDEIQRALEDALERAARHVRAA